MNFKLYLLLPKNMSSKEIVLVFTFISSFYLLFMDACVLSLSLSLCVEMETGKINSDGLMNKKFGTRKQTKKYILLLQNFNVFYKLFCTHVVPHSALLFESCHDDFI